MADQDDTIAALMHYVGHVAPCQASYLAGRASARTVIGGWRSVFDNPPACTCGLDDVLRGIEARKAGRIVAPTKDLLIDPSVSSSSVDPS